jgi:hypothetical protein
MKKVEPQDRNWALVTVASLMIVFNLVLLVVVSLYWSVFGWWSLVAIIAAVASIYLAVTAIRTNDPTWILLDLVLPG